MDLKQLRGGTPTSAEEHQFRAELRSAKDWFHGHWDRRDVKDVNDAIRSAVGAELTYRDNREFGISMSGQLHDPLEEQETKGTGQVQKGQRIAVDPARRGMRSGGDQHRKESTRRMHMFIHRRPDPKILAKLLPEIAQDDGKDAKGEWLCGRQGFTDELPRWMPKARRLVGRPAGKDVPEPVGA